jgi:hypothetical protein
MAVAACSLLLLCALRTDFIAALVIIAASGACAPCQSAARGLARAGDRR